MRKWFFFVLFCVFLSLSLPCFAEVDPRRAKEYIQLKPIENEQITQNLLSVLTNKWMDLLTSTQSSPETQAVIVTVRKGVRAHVFNYFFLELPEEAAILTCKAALEAASLIGSPNKAKELVGLLEKVTTEMAMQKTMDFLLRNEMKVGTGELPLKYTSQEGRENYKIPYVLVFKPKTHTTADVVVSFYSPEKINPPLSEGDPYSINFNDAWEMKKWSENYSKIPPFILQIKGTVEEKNGSFFWTGTPQFELTYPDNVPTLDFSKPSFASRLGNVFANRLFNLNLVKEIRGQIKGFSQDLFRFKPQEKELLQSSMVKTSPEEKPEEEKEIKGEQDKPEKEDNTPPPRREVVEIRFGDIKKDVEKMKKYTQILKDNLSQEVEEKPEKEKEKFVCSPTTKQTPARDSVVINEVAWMGTPTSHYDEWIELKNISSNKVDLEGWVLLNKGGGIEIEFGEMKALPSSFLLLERTDDDSVPAHKADLIYKGALKNSDETLLLFDSSCRLQDKVEAEPEWPGGDNETKRTMERKSNLKWQTSDHVEGTPKGENTIGWEVPDVKGAQDDQSEESAENDGGVDNGDNNGSSDSGSGNEDDGIEETDENNNEESNGEESGEDNQSEDAKNGETPPPKWCDQNNLQPPLQDKVIINEVAWMGTPTSYNDEWIEFKNISNHPVSLKNWQLINQNENIRIILDEKIMAPGDFFLLERTNDDSVPHKTADQIYSKPQIRNSDESLTLFSSTCQVEDRVIAAPDWPAGNNEEKKTMERGGDLSWYTYTGEEEIGGTPKEENSPPPQPEPPPEPEPLPEPTPPTETVPPPLIIFPQNGDVFSSENDQNPEKEGVQIIFHGETIPNSTVFVNGEETEQEETYWEKEVTLKEGPHPYDVFAKKDDIFSEPIVLEIHLEEKETTPKVVINEIAWMGMTSPHNEWLELKNTSNTSVDVKNWSIFGAKNEECIDFAENDGYQNTVVPPQEYLVYATHKEDLKNEEEESLVDVWDSSISLNNTSPSEIILFSSPGCEGEKIDRVDVADGWFVEKEDDNPSMERVDPFKNSSDPQNWAKNNKITRNGVDASDNPVNGTPGKKNSAALKPRMKNMEVEAEKVGRNEVELFWGGELLNKEVIPENLSWEVRYSMEEITEENWEKAHVFQSFPFHKLETLVSPLLFDRTYYFSLQVVDEKGNRSRVFFSNPIQTDPPSEDPWWSHFKKDNKRSGFADIQVPLPPYDSVEKIFDGNATFLRFDQNNHLYLRSEGKVHCLDASSNYEEKWVFTPKEDEYFHELVLGDDGTIFTFSYRVVALDPLGNKLWEKKLGESPRYQHITTSGDNLYVLSSCLFEENGEDKEIKPLIFAFDKKGEVEWAFRPGDSPETFENPNFECKLKEVFTEAAPYKFSPAVDNQGNLYFTTSNELYSLSNQGELNWRVRFEVMPLLTSPSLDEKGNLYLFTGKKLWEIRLSEVPASREEIWDVENLDSAQLLMHRNLEGGLWVRPGLVLAPNGIYFHTITSSGSRSVRYVDYHTQEVKRFRVPHSQEVLTASNNALFVGKKAGWNMPYWDLTSEEVSYFKEQLECNKPLGCNTRGTREIIFTPERDILVAGVKGVILLSKPGP